MAYVFLAIGALMALIGIYAVVTGYPIIQVEQGWATVISGATLIAGGAVTSALGLVLRTLVQLKSLTARQQTTVPLSAPMVSIAEPEPIAANAAAPVIAPVPDALMEKASIPPDTAPLSREALPDLTPQPPPVDPFEAEPVQALRPSEPETPAPPLQVPPAPPAPTPDVAHDDPESVAAHPGEIVLALPTEVQAVDTPAVEAPIADMAKPEAVEATEPEVRETTLERPKVEEPESPAMDDWLDRALAEIDRDNPPPQPPPADRPINRPVVRIGPPIRRRAAETAPDPEPDPVLPPLPEPALAEGEPPLAVHTVPPPTAAPTSAVIGRYEADGTSYVMYADGSIEAQSEGGVYRFSSMAELKAFIEA